MGAGAQLHALRLAEGEDGPPVGADAQRIAPLHGCLLAGGQRRLTAGALDGDGPCRYGEAHAAR